MSKRFSSEPQPFDVPNNLLAKKLSSVNSKLDAFSRELGEESTLIVLINTPITLNFSRTKRLWAIIYFVLSVLNK
jgi:uncharacterized protein (DUF1501 family)